MGRKLAIVFGGTRGIGAACVRALAEDGYDVALTGVSDSPPVLPNVSGARLESYRVRVEDSDTVSQVFSNVAQDFGADPHCVVANAGINVPPAHVGEFEIQQFHRLVEVNLLGAFNVLSNAARHVQGGGSIIGITTSLVRHVVPGVGPYAATKAAVESLLRSMSRELASRSVRVNGVAPGPVDTDLFRSGKDDAAVARAAAMSPFNRVGRVDEIAGVVAFLASGGASWINGQIVQPNGGLV